MTITLKISENTKEKMVDYFFDKRRPKTPPYAVFQANESDTVVTLYESGKVVFQGVSADIDARMWKEMEQHLNPSKKVEMTSSGDKDKKEKKEIYVDPVIYGASSIGSDEVGTGDYFGPIVVTAAFLDKQYIPFLEDLGVKDSKKMTDEKILEIVPEIIKVIPYESVVVSNKEYNEMHVNMNLNKIKAVMHNKVLCNMRSKGFKYEYIVVDEFAMKYVYYSYLKGLPNVCRNITFMTKAEDKCLSVACASLISRYIFLKEFDKIGDSLGMFLPKGASNLVDEAGAKIVNKYGVDKLNDIVKLHFKNTERILEMSNKEKQ